MSALVKLNTILALLSEMEAGDREVALSIISSHYGPVSAVPSDDESVPYPRYGADQYGVVTDQWGYPLTPSPPYAPMPLVNSGAPTGAAAPPLTRIRRDAPPSRGDGAYGVT